MADKYQKMSRKKTVLVISDRQEQFALTASLLRRDGYLVLFQRKLTSMDEIKDSPPNLIICELAAADIDGPTICRQVRDEPCQEKTPILLVGDLPERSAIVTGSLKCGAANYLQKPVDTVELADLSREMLESEENIPLYDVRECSFGSFRDIKSAVTDGTGHIESSQSAHLFTGVSAEPEFEGRPVIRWVSKFKIIEDLISTN